MRLAEVFDALLSGDGLLGTLAGASVRTRALAADREATAVTHAAIAGDVAQPRNVLLHLAAELTFDRVILIQERGDAGDFVFTKLAGMGLRIDSSFVAELSRGPWTDAV